MRSFFRSAGGWCRRFWLASLALLWLASSHVNAQAAEGLRTLGTQAISDGQKFGSAATAFFVAIIVLGLVVFLGYAIWRLTQPNKD